MACQLVAPFAWIMGNRVKAEIEAAPAQHGGLQQTNIGRILGIVGTVLLSLYVLGFIAYVVFVVAIFSASSA